MLACSKRSDSGERCEVKKAMKSRGGLGREVRIHNINFWSKKFWIIRKKIINVRGWNTSHDWQVKTTYSWCGLSGRKSLFKTNLTGVPSLTSPPPSLLFFRAPFTSHRSPLSERLEQATPMLNGHFVKRALSWPCLQGGHYVSYLARRKMLG